MALYRPKELLSFLKEEKISPKKSLSQNFLIDGNIVRKIIKAVDVLKGEPVLEIGPGVGVLTEALLQKGAKMVAIEKDRRLAASLKKRFDIEVVADDFLKVKLNLEKKTKLVANLPYNLSTPIINKILNHSSLFSTCTLMLQKEMALRLIAPKRSKKYCPLTLLVNLFSTPKILFNVKRSCFFPKPKVQSTVIQFTMKNPPELDHKSFFEFIQKAFQKRRKTLFTIFKDNPRLKQILQKPLARAEELSLEEFIDLFRKMKSST